jgi:hypothetical protein
MATKRFKDWLFAHPKWGDPVKWTGTIQPRLAIAKYHIARSSFHLTNDARPPTSAALHYQNPFTDLDSHFFMLYLGGQIAIRNGDSERAQGLLLKAMVVAKQCSGAQKIGYLIKVFTNLQVLYRDTNQKEELLTVLEELEALKSGLAEVKLLNELSNGALFLQSPCIMSVMWLFL